MRRLRATKWKIKRCHFMTNLQISIFLDNSSKQGNKKEEIILYPLLFAFFLRPNEDVLWLCLNKTNYRGVWTNFLDNNSNFHPALYERADRVITWGWDEPGASEHNLFICFTTN